MASSPVRGRPVSELKATMRIRAPSRARTLLRTRSAITSSASSSASSIWSCWARLRRITRRVRDVGRFDVGHKPGGEALPQTVLERLQVVRGPVGGEHDLAAAVVQGVERVEELLLGPRLALEELHVVQQQHVDVAEARLEPPCATAAERVQEFVREGLARGAAHGQARAVREQHAGDRAQQVCLADARGPEDEQWVVGLRGHLGHGQGGGVGEPVAVADHELVERQLGIAERPGERVEVVLALPVRARGPPPARVPPQPAPRFALLRGVRAAVRRP